METTDKCIILKKKEYEDLLLKAGEKPHFVIQLQSGFSSLKADAVYSHTIDLSEKLLGQIRRIYSKIRVENVKHYHEHLAEVKAQLENKYKDTKPNCSDNTKDIENAYRDLAKMSWWKRYKFLKQYKD